MCEKLQSGTLGYVRGHTEFEGLPPPLMPLSNLKFCVFSITELFSDVKTQHLYVYAQFPIT